MVAYLEHKDLTNEVITPQREREIHDGVARVRDEVAHALAANGRDENAVTILAATKTRDIGEIRVALNAGIRAIGENRPQEIQIKAPLLADDLARLGVDYHLIGQLQKNKINKVLGIVSTIESVDSAQQAAQIGQRFVARGEMPVLPGQTLVLSAQKVFLEVNESGEMSKSGCEPEQAYEEALAIAATPGVELAGLMTVGAHVSDESRVRSGFAALRELRDKIVTSHEPGTQTCTELSMGMTHDIAWAIAEGSTQLRIGTGIFGARAFI